MLMGMLKQIIRHLNKRGIDKKLLSTIILQYCYNPSRIYNFPN